MTHIETHIERLARESAAALSDAGEEDWRRYVSLARRIDERVSWQFLPLMVQQGGAELAS